MIRFLTDENFNGDIIRAAFTLFPEIDLVRAVDVGLARTEDPVILEWAAREGRLLLTHDARTMAGYAYDRVIRGLAMPGVFEVKPNRATRVVAEDIVLIAQCSEPADWSDQVRYLPL